VLFTNSGLRLDPLADPPEQALDSSEAAANHNSSIFFWPRARIRNLSGGAEDSAELQKFGTGKPAINFAVATRYLHTHNSVIDCADLDRAVDLLVKILPLTSTLKPWMAYLDFKLDMES